MSTRTRSRARQPVQEEVQARITETFKATRKGTSAPSKSLKEAVIEDVKPVTKPKTATKTTKRVKKEQIVVKEVERAAEKTEKEASIPPISPLESPPRRPRKTPTPPSSPPREEKPAVRRLFSNAEPEVPALPFGLKEKPAEPKKTKVNLMERLAAKNPSLAKIHEQMSTNKAKRVEQHVELLKSPTKAAGLPLSPKKMAPVFISPTKRPIAIKVGKKPLSNTEPVPEFVLPSHTTPAKERTEEEEAVELSKRHLFEKGHTARLFDVVKNNNEVELPHKYQNLLEKFHCCDRIVSIFTGRGSRCEATEIFKNVQKNTKKEFGRKTLAQIMALYPKSYNLRLEEQRNLAGQLIGRFDLVLEPNLVDDLSEYMRPESPKKALMEEPLPKVLPGHCLSPMKSPRKKIAQPEAREAELDLRSKLEGWRIMNRKYIMYHLLAERVQKCHQKFMEKLGEKVGPVRRFHPSFLAKLDAECVDIEPAALPEPPRKEVAFKNVEEFMSSLREPETAVDVALKELAAGEETSTSRNIPLSPKKFAQIQAAKPAGARSLLERIRAKEAVKKAAESQRDPEAERCYHLLELLHSKLIRPLLSMYVQKNCRSMQLQLALEKLEYSTKRTKTELLSCLEYLCVTAPNHARIAEVASSKYLQIEQTAHEDIRRAIKTAFEATSRPSTFSITSR